MSSRSILLISILFVFINLIVIAIGIYWLLALYYDLPLSATFRQLCLSRAHRLGVGAEYQVGRWLLIACFVLPVILLWSWWKGYKEQR